jgi:hypothetical protein
LGHSGSVHVKPRNVANPLVLLLSPPLLHLHWRAVFRFRLLPAAVYHPFLQALACPCAAALGPLRSRLLGYGAWAMASGSLSHSSHPQIVIATPHSSQLRQCRNRLANRKQRECFGLRLVVPSALRLLRYQYLSPHTSLGRRPLLLRPWPETSATLPRRLQTS